MQLSLSTMREDWLTYINDSFRLTLNSCPCEVKDPCSIAADLLASLTRSFALCNSLPACFSHSSSCCQCPLMLIFCLTEWAVLIKYIWNSDVSFPPTGRRHHFLWQAFLFCRIMSFTFKMMAVFKTIVLLGVWFPNWLNMPRLWLS